MEYHPSQPPNAGRSRPTGQRQRSRGLGRWLDLSARGLLSAVLVTAVWPAAAAAAGRVSVTDVRHWSLGDVTRVAVEVSGEFTYKYRRLSNPDRIYYDIRNSRQRVSRELLHVIEVGDGLVAHIRLAQNQPTVTRVVLDLSDKVVVTASQLANPDRLMIEVRRKARMPAVSQAHRLPPPAGSVSRKPAAKAVTQSASVRRPEPGLTKPPQPTEAAPPKSTVVQKSPAVSEQSAKTESRQVKASPPPRTAKLVEKPAADPSWSTGSPPAGQPAAALPPKSAPPPARPTPPPKQVASVKTQSTAAPAATPEPDPADNLIAKPAERNRGGGRSLTRALGLKLGRVVIDPGHGGRDTGTIGPTGLREKDVTLDVARRLAKLIEDGLGSEVVLTRTKDTTIRLKQRTELANREQADLFISIHVNSSKYRSVNGVETFYLNFTQSRADLDVAARENAGSDMPMHELSNLVQKIALDDKLQESRDLALNLQTAVYKLHRKHSAKARNRGVKKAPFVVLIGAQMPSVLVELGFISNAREEKLLKTSQYRQGIAEALYAGIAKYANSLSQFQVARSTGPDDE